MISRPISIGHRYSLPSGNVVEVVGFMNRSEAKADCAYIKNGITMKSGIGQSGRVALRLDWIMRFAKILSMGNA